MPNLPGIEASFDLDSFVPTIRPRCFFRVADRQSLPLVQALPALRSWVCHIDTVLFFRLKES
ncbi:hypothetical protein GE21DRAFT_1283844 [Neurospora crassa]|nr:hypothetical protein GE21DRAFT_1283844 [Neurospora crassa]